ncbi:MAG TPA: ABC transporter permease [Candidatus Acidoferrales bacterium]|nr:ABC transporter permease [Candidatus Acidoferrales bacterium]
MTKLWQDLRYAARVFVKSPGFTAIAIIALALGIGANTAIFSLMDAVLLKTLPVKNAQQLILFTWDDNKWPAHYSQTGWDSRFSFSYPQFEMFRKENKSLSSVFTFAPLGSSPDNTTITVDGDAGLANGVMVSGEYFSGLGVSPLMGRGITEQDEDKGAPRVAVVSYGYWTRRFGRDPGVLGRRVELNGLPCTIVGVAPRTFSGMQPGLQPDVYVAFDDLPNLRPWSQKPTDTDSFYVARNWIVLNILGRLKPGISRRQAEAELNALFHNFITSDWKPAKPSDVPAFTLTPGSQGIPNLREGFSQPLQILMVLVGVALLIACANVATLLLARASARQKEISVRLAIGASPARLLRQLLTESILLSLLGGAVGLLFAGWGTNMLLAMFAGGANQISLDVGPDLTVLLFTLGVAVATGILFGLAPALRISRMDLASIMKDSNASAIGGREKHRLGNSLVVAQVAASLVLMVAAGLFVRTLVNYENQDYGFNQEHLLTFGIDGSRQGYQGARLVSLYSQLQDRLQTLPGVISAAAISEPPFNGWSSNTTIALDGRPATVDFPLRYMRVGPDFFGTMGIPVVLGRGITRSDIAASPMIAVVDENFVKKYFPHENPIGHHFSLSRDADPKYTLEIIGVAKPAELVDPHNSPRPKAYAPYAAFPERLGSMFFDVRSAGDPTTVISEIRDTVRRLDPGLPMMEVKTQTEEREEALVQETLFARLSGFFDLLALLLATVGLYGTMSYAVSRKTREIGIRMALGAEPGNVMHMVVGNGIKLAGIGAAIGVVCALSTARLARSLIFGVTPQDPWTLIGAVVILMLVAAFACYIPARRAMKVDPMVALRYE